MWIRSNPNPKGKQAPDCVIRAISIALGMSWYEVYDDLCAVGRIDCNMPSADAVWGHYLQMRGFRPLTIAAATPAAVGDYWHVSGDTTVDVPVGCCTDVAIVNASVSATPATVPAPAITSRNLNVEIERKA